MIDLKIVKEFWDMRKNLSETVSKDSITITKISTDPPLNSRILTSTLTGTENPLKKTSTTKIFRSDGKESWKPPFPENTSSPLYPTTEPASTLTKWWSSPTTCTESETPKSRGWMSCTTKKMPFLCRKNPLKWRLSEDLSITLRCWSITQSTTNSLTPRNPMPNWSGNPSNSPLKPSPEPSSTLLTKLPP